MKTIINVFGLLFISMILISCGGGSGEKSSDAETSTKTESSDALPAQTENTENDVKLQQYVVQGKEIYKTYCLACHQSEGQGLAKLYPPLANSDWLKANPEKAVCGIRYGQYDPITVNGVQYNQIMPPIPTLSDLEIAEVITYVSNSWGNNAGLYDVKQVTEWLNACEKKP